jgi:hypothetical protein
LSIFKPTASYFPINFVPRECYPCFSCPFSTSEGLNAIYRGFAATLVCQFISPQNHPIQPDYHISNHENLLR